MKQLNIMLGLKNNTSCLNVKEFFENQIGQYFHEGYELGIVHHTFLRQEVDDAVASGQYDVVFVLEKMENDALGQGAIKKWRAANADIRIILAMDIQRRHSAKAKGLYDIGYYNGLFVSELGNISEIIMLIESGRSEEEAYNYYDLANFVEVPNKKRKTPVPAVETVEDVEQTPFNVDALVSENVVPNLEPQEEVIDDVDIQLQSLSVPLQPTTYSVKVTANEKTVESDSSEEKYSEATKQDTVYVDQVEREARLYSREDLALRNSFHEKEVAEESKEETKKEIINNIMQEVVPVRNSEEAVSQNETLAGGMETDENEESFNSVYFNDSIAEKTFSSSTTEERGRDRKELPLLQKKTKEIKYEETESILDIDTAKQYLNKRLQESSVRKKDTKTNEEPSNKEKLFHMVYEHYTTQLFKLMEEYVTGKTMPEIFIDGLFDYIESLTGTPEDKIYAYKRFEAFLSGYDVLNPLIEMEEITDIHVLDECHTRVKKGNVRLSANVCFEKRERYLNFCKYLKMRNRNELSYAGDMILFTDEKFMPEYYLQISLTNDEMTLGRNLELFIRKTPKEKINMQHLLKDKYITDVKAAYLLNELSGDKGILVCGKSGSAKTTFLNALIDYLPKTMAAVVVQYRNEITAGNLPEITIQRPYISNKHEITVPILAENALTRDTDFYILGDVRGEEAFFLYQACISGLIPIACVTVDDPVKCIYKIANYIIMKDSSLLLDMVVKRLVEKIGTIVYMEKWCVKQVLQIRGFGVEGIDYKYIN